MGISLWVEIVGEGRQGMVGDEGARRSAEADREKLIERYDQSSRAWLHTWGFASVSWLVIVENVLFVYMRMKCD